jgi:CCR4-NOT transcription complex subunit 7/8
MGSLQLMLVLVSRSGYDFGYLVKILTCSPLPPTEAEFFGLLELWFPSIYDIKHIMRSCKSLKGGLQDVADSLQVRLHFNFS